MVGFRKILLMFSFLCLSIGLASASITDIYIAQNATGSGSGADCNDAYAASWFNNSSNWGGGSTQIGPGTTVHLCGAFNMSAGSSGVLTIQANGSSGNPIVLKFEPGASANAPYWGTHGFITANGKSYITVDGGTNGTIQATANGVGLANQVGNGNAIYFASVNNAEVKNLTCSNMFVASQNASNNETTGGATSCIWWDSGSNVTIDNNTFHDVFYGIYKPYESGNSNYNIFGNKIYNISTGIVVGSGNDGATLTGANTVHDNIIHDTALWDASGDANHHDYIHLWAVHSGSQISAIQVYNNYLYGTGGCCMTAYLYIECSSSCSSPGINAEVFNNVIYNSDPNSDLSTGAGGNGEMECEGSTCFIRNNTFVGITNKNYSNVGIHFENGSTLTLQGNIFSTLGGAIAGSSGTIVTSDYQDAYNTGNFFIDAPINGCGNGCSLKSWQAGGQDAHSTTGNPELTSSFQLSGSTSAAWQTAVNLTAMAIPPLDSDKAGVQRPASGNWDMGAYESSASTTAQGPTAPGNLRAQVQ